MEIEVKNNNNQVVGSETLPDALFGAKVSEPLIWEDVRHFLAVGRAGTASTKTRAEVRGGGKKPWRQKGTGRARHGSIRSPLWRGGGITFGPRPRNYAYKIPKKKRWGALYSALTQKAKDGAIVVLDSLSFDAPKTKLLIALLQNLNLQEKKILIVDKGENENLRLSARNLSRVETAMPMAIRSYNVINADVLLITQPALRELCEGAPKWN